MIERSQISSRREPDTPEIIRDAVIAAFENLGAITFEWKGRHLVSKPSGKGGPAGYLRSLEIMAPAAFQTIVRRVFRYALDDDNVGAVYQTLTDPDAIQPTLYEFLSMWIKSEIKSNPRAASLPKAKAKRRVKELLDELDRGPASVDLRSWSV
jgi:hypothetical protein